MTRLWSSVNKEMANVVLSIDGRKEVNDKMRPFRKRNGKLRSHRAEISEICRQPESGEAIT